MLHDGESVSQSVSQTVNQSISAVSVNCSEEKRLDAQILFANYVDQWGRVMDGHVPGSNPANRRTLLACQKKHPLTKDGATSRTDDRKLALEVHPPTITEMTQARRPEVEREAEVGANFDHL